MSGILVVLYICTRTSGQELILNLKPGYLNASVQLDFALLGLLILHTHAWKLRNTYGFALLCGKYSRGPGRCLHIQLANEYKRFWDDARFLQGFNNQGSD